jgi:hypothetical protein
MRTIPTLIATAVLMTTLIAITFAQEAADTLAPEADAPETVESIWAVQLGDDSPSVGLGLAIDDEGAAYIAGWTEGLLAPDQTSAGKADAFLAKVSPDGETVWVKQFGTPAIDLATRVWVQGDTLYAAGTTGDALFGAHVGHHATCSCEIENLWLAAFDLDGTELWSTQFGVASHLTVTGLVMDDDDNAYLIGMVWESMPGSTHKGGQDMFIIKFDSAGTRVWSQNIGRAGSEVAHRLLLGSDGTLYMIGQVKDQWDAPLTEGDGGDIVVVAVDPDDGSELWAQQYGSTRYDRPYDATIDPETDTIYITGFTSGDFAGDHMGGGNDGFLLALDADGNWLWIDPIATTGWEQAMGMSMTTEGNVLVAGMGDNPFGATPTGAGGVFLLEYAPDGVRESAIQYSHDLVSIVTEAGDVDPSSGAIYIVGSTMSSIARERSGSDNDAILLKFQYPSATTEDDAAGPDSDTPDQPDTPSDPETETPE